LEIFLKMGIIKDYFENYWKIRFFFVGISIIILGIFFLINYNQVLAGAAMILIGIIVITASITLLKTNR